MNVLLLAESYPCAELPTEFVFIHNQAKALQNAGYNVAVLVFDIRSFRKKRELGFSTYKYDGVLVYRYAIPCGPIPILSDIARRVAIKRGMKRVIKLFSVDYIHAHFYMAGYEAVWIKKKYQIPFIVTEHSSGIVLDEIKTKESRKIREAYANATVLISVGSLLKQKMGEYTNKSIQVIPNAIPKHFHYYDDKKSEKFTFITVGHLISRKRIDMVIRAFDKFHAMHNDSELLIIGTGPLLMQMEQLIEKLNLNSSVKLLGAIDNNKLPNMYRACHCFVLGSTKETFGVVTAEAAACGLPVVSSDNGGVSDIINQDNMGIIIQEDTVDAMALAMEKIYTNYSDYKPELIAESIRKRFTDHAVVEQIIEIYQRL